MSERYRRTVNPTSEPVTLEDFKAHARVDYDDQDTVINNQITAARLYCEEYLQRSFITTTWALTMEEFPCEEIELQRANLIAVSSITYIDTAGATQTLDASHYRVDAYSEPPEIEPAWGYYWPFTREISNAVTVTFTAGYGATAASVPQTIKQAILLLAAHWFENREYVSGQTVNTIPMTIESLLMTERWSLR